MSRIRIFWVWRGRCAGESDGVLLSQWILYYTPLFPLQYKVLHDPIQGLGLRGLGF